MRGAGGAPADRAALIASLPPGRVQVRRLSPPAARATPPTDPLQLRVRVVAEQAPLGSLAAALSDAVGVSVVVDAPLVGVRVSMTLVDVPVAVLLTELRERYRVQGELTDGVLHLDAPWRARQRAQAAQPQPPPARSPEPQPPPEPPPLETRLIPTDRLPAESLALAYCHQLASPRGSAVVVGRSLVVQDTPSSLAALERLVREIERRERSPRH